MYREWYERSFEEKKGIVCRRRDRRGAKREAAALTRRAEAPEGARAREGDAEGEVERIRGSRRGLPSGDRSRDAADDRFTSFGCFAEPGDPSKAVREIHRERKPGGKLPIGYPSESHVRSRLPEQAGPKPGQVRGDCGGSGCEAGASARPDPIGRRAG
ncbi:hypothetical protein H7B90_13575 [Cohnella xylanilytica]|uniref:Uncharacterized protein n=1 Tax=Cohnella xylanilytica TaxID=557555 RepID=A0A841TW73_9BACL|nr:hypothetical protein [Cohnella xylanilytica]MBB6692435.1 hypothetical protein [Cohnella xylanilytica]